ncbi:TfoX/Sxy family protein [Nocardioides sp. TF02-7]|uniref:TfoX/Sxy family protein n=1 Tax=Nocardioides sp. TF02-7 TaxID=2917724 RepID=UPI001F0517C1|nr:TfoX/Sxy family protein [Nocardioides sp. TF02-7]UMG92693.1 TfoX/Sxy family protein [Nocardioides sp. TF02-7]
MGAPRSRRAADPRRPGVGGKDLRPPARAGDAAPRAVSQFYTADVFMHTWDLARATGQDERLDEDRCRELYEAMVDMEEVLRGSGQYGPAVPVPADAGWQGPAGRLHRPRPGVAAAGLSLNAPGVGGAAYAPVMAYDTALADRIRELLGGGAEVTEKRMFGGLAFLVGGNMAVAVSGGGGIMVRVDPAEGVELLASTPAHPMEMRGRALRGWLRVDGEHLAGDDLADWVRRGAAYAGSLPPK